MLTKLTSRTKHAALGAALALTALAIFASPSLAAIKYVDDASFHSQFDSAFESTNYWAKDKTIPTLHQVAVDNSSSTSKGDIYVAVSGAAPAGTVDKFKVEGSGSSIKVTFLCELGGTNMEAAAHPCVSGKQDTAEALTTLEQVTVGPSGEVYVVNQGNKVVDEFNAEGEYEGQIKETSAGTAFTKPWDVAVGLDGEVYVADEITSTESLLDKFEGGVFKYSIRCGSATQTTGTLIEDQCGTLTSWRLNAYGGLAVDGSGNVYVADDASGHEVVYKFNNKGEYTGQIKETLKAEAGVAIQPGTSNLFLGEKTKVAWYNSDGNLWEDIAVISPEALPKATNAIAATTAGNVYVAEGSQKTIQMFEVIEPKYVDDASFHSQFDSAFESTNYWAKDKTIPTLHQVAVDNSSSTSKGDIYVAVSGAAPAGTVDKFKVEGSGSSIKVTFLCELGGTNMEAAAHPCVSGKQDTAEALTTLEQVTVGPSGEVYVVNQGNKVVDEFNAEGEYEGQIKETSAGTAFTKPWDVAVGLDGEVYVADEITSTESLLDKFEGGVFKYSIRCGSATQTTGTLIEDQCGTLTSWRLNAYGGLAVDGSGNVYVADDASGHEVVYKFNNKGEYTGQIKETLKAEAGVAIQPGTSNLFLGEKTKVAWYNSDGNLWEDIAVISPEALPKATNAIAATTAGNVYVAEGSQKTIQMFELAVEEPAKPPAVSACTVSATTADSTTVEGTVNPEENETKYEFEYGTSTSYGSATTQVTLAAADTAQPVTTTIGSLIPSTKFFCRIKATSLGGESKSATNTEFTTKSALPTPETGEATAIGAGSATLNGSLEPEGNTIEWFFEYGTTTVSENQAPLPAGSTDANAKTPETQVVSGLSPLTLYRYRLTGKREINGVTYTVHGPEKTFSTGGLAPDVVSQTANGTTAFSATLEGVINPENGGVTYWFVYGTSESQEQAFVPAGHLSGDGPTPIEPETIQDLQPDTTYFFALVAEDSQGRVEGVAGTQGSFKTLSASAPVVALAAVGVVTQTTASLSGSVEANGLPTSYEVQLGSEGAWVTLTGGATEVPTSIAYTLSNLAPGATYEVRLVARSAAGEAISAPQTFTTTGAPGLALVQPPAPTLIPTPTIEKEPEPVEAASVKATKHTVSGDTITITLKAPAGGKLTASGTDVKKASKSVKVKGSYKLEVKLTKAARKTLKRKGKLTVTIKVAFMPTTGAASKATVNATLTSEHAKGKLTK